MKTILGVGVDLTQHVPLVATAECPETVTSVGDADPAALAKTWPPRVELRGNFLDQAPVCLLPLLPGEPPIVGNAAARHRRAAGLPWPPEAQVPYGGDENAGIGRVPLLAAWAAVVPPPGREESMTRRIDPEFGWRPEGRNLAVYAGPTLQLSLRAFLKDAELDPNSHCVGVVVPDALDEAGQQIILDGCLEAGLDPETIHLVPRAVAVALWWCHAARRHDLTVGTDDEDGSPVGRLRILTASMDMWEAVSLEIRCRRVFGKVWFVPLRDRMGLGNARPELGFFGVSLAAALAFVHSGGFAQDWWPKLFSSGWLSQRLQSDRQLSPQEEHVVRGVLAGTLPASVQREFEKLGKHQAIWRQFSKQSSPIRSLTGPLWTQQEHALDISKLPLLALIADGSFSELLINYDGIDDGSRASEACVLASGRAAVHGAALAAAAIAHGIPSYREKLLPLDLCVRGIDEYDDPIVKWQQLVAATSVEAGRTWRSPEPVTGLKIERGQDHLVLPLRRSFSGRDAFRRVATKLTQPVPRDEAVCADVEVKPGQGFARVRISSIIPGIFCTRLDWRTMEECEEPAPPLLAYIPGVSRVLPDREMFVQAEPVMREVVKALEKMSPKAMESLRELVQLLNKWPLAHTVERRRGRVVPKDFMLHYGVIGSEGALDVLRAPGLARGLRKLIGERFRELERAGEAESDLGKCLLRAGGWFYLAIPEQCADYLRRRLEEATRGGKVLSPVELHAIGLSFQAAEDLRRFYPLFAWVLGHRENRPNNWLRALRNICRFRNHALSHESVSDAVISDLATLAYELLAEQVAAGRFRKIFANCLEPMLFLLKRRRYDPCFLAPDTPLAGKLIRLLREIDKYHRYRLARRLQEVPRAAVNLLCRQATSSDVEALLSVEDERESDG